MKLERHHIHKQMMKQAKYDALVARVHECETQKRLDAIAGGLDAHLKQQEEEARRAADEQRRLDPRRP